MDRYEPDPVRHGRRRRDAERAGLEAQRALQDRRKIAESQRGKLRRRPGQTSQTIRRLFDVQATNEQKEQYTTALHNYVRRACDPHPHMDIQNPTTNNDPYKTKTLARKAITHFLDQLTKYNPSGTEHQQTKAALEQRDSNGDNALATAIALPSPEAQDIAIELIDAGINTQCSSKLNALEQAIEYGRDRVVSKLLAAAPELSVQDHNKIQAVSFDHSYTPDYDYHSYLAALKRHEQHSEPESASLWTDDGLLAIEAYIKAAYSSEADTKRKLLAETLEAKRKILTELLKAKKLDKDDQVSQSQATEPKALVDIAAANDHKALMADLINAGAAITMHTIVEAEQGHEQARSRIIGDYSSNAKNIRFKQESPLRHLQVTKFAAEDTDTGKKQYRKSGSTDARTPLWWANSRNPDRHTEQAKAKAALEKVKEEFPSKKR